MFKKLLLFSLFLILAILLMYCSLIKDDTPKVKTIQLTEYSPSLFHAPHYVAINQGFFTREGLIVEINKTSQDEEGLLTKLLSGETDLALISSNLALSALGEDANEKIIGFAQLTQKEGSFIISREARSYFRWEDIKKKIIIGGPQGTLAKVTLEYVLKENEINTYKDVDIIYNLPSFELASGVFKGGSGDFVQLNEPSASLLEEEEKGHLITSFATEIGEIASSIFIASPNYINENPEIIQKFTNGLYLAQIWCARHNAEEIAQVIKPFFPLVELDIITKAIDRYKKLDVWCPNPLIQKKAVNKLQEVMLKTGELREEIPWEKYIDNSFAQKSIEDIPLPKEEKKPAISQGF